MIVTPESFVRNLGLASSRVFDALAQRWDRSVQAIASLAGMTGPGLSRIARPQEFARSAAAFRRASR